MLKFVRNAIVCISFASGIYLAPISMGPDKKCQSGTRQVHDTCVDEFEIPNVKGVRPLVMLSALEAEKWCNSIGKRLCTSREWTDACSGPDELKYPYGREWVSRACNDEKEWIDRDEKKLESWPSKTARGEVERVWQGDKSGDRQTCRSGYGVYDMTGNAEEWVSDGDGGYILMGCYWNGCFDGKKPTCNRKNVTHNPTWRYYHSSARCCKDLQ